MRSPSLSERIVPPLEGICYSQADDGSLTIIQGTSTVSFSPLEMTQIERGLICEEQARDAIKALFGIQDTLEKALGSASQKRTYKEARNPSRN